METSTGGEKHVVVFIDVVDRPEVEASAVVAINRVSDLMEYFPTHENVVGHLSLDQQTSSIRFEMSPSVAQRTRHLLVACRRRGRLCGKSKAAGVETRLASRAHYGWRNVECVGRNPAAKQKGESAMTRRHATLPTFFTLILCFVCSASSGAWAQAGTITKGMQDNCANDYRKFCGDYGLQTSALTLCMRKAGPSLSPACVRALVQAGKVSQADVDRIKAQMKGGR